MKNRITFLLILLSCMLAALPLAAQDAASRQKSRKAKLEKEIAILDRQLKDNATRSASALSKLTLTRKKVEARRALIKESDKEIAELSGSIMDKESQIAALEAELDTMTVRYHTLVRNAYRNRDPQLWAVYLLSSGSLPQATRRYAYLRRLSSALNSQAAGIIAMKDSLAADRTRLEVLRTEANVLRTARTAEFKNLSREEAESAKVVSQLKRDKNRYQKQLTDKRRQVEALNKEISRIIASSRKGTAASRKPVDVKLSGEFAANRGKLPWPAEGAIVDHFGQHYHPVYTSVLLPFNNGVTVAVQPGTDVKAVFGGTVSQVIVMPGYNQCVLVQHGGYYTFYCKLGKVSVKAGDKVTTGQTLGKVDTIAGETQVHFQLWDGKDPQDPEDWLR